MLRAVAEGVALVGAAFVLLAGIGVLRFSDLYARMHAATKASSLGIGLIGVAAAVISGGGHTKPLVAVGFIFVTVAAGAHMVGRAAYRAEGIEVDLASRDDLADIVGEVDAPLDED